MRSTPIFIPREILDEGGDVVVGRGRKVGAPLGPIEARGQQRPGKSQKNEKLSCFFPGWAHTEAEPPSPEEEAFETLDSCSACTAAAAA
jgi:hypothetical protein